MPTSLSLQDLRRGEKLQQRNLRRYYDDNNEYYQQYLHQQIEFDNDFGNDFREENIIIQDLINVHEDDGRQVMDVEYDNMSIPAQIIQNIPINDHYGMEIGSEQVVVESIDEDAQEFIEVEFHQDREEPGALKKNKNSHLISTPNVVSNTKDEKNTRDDDADKILQSEEFLLFEHSQIGLYEFSTEFLALTRKHRLQPKVRAILLDLLIQVMPQENRCPLTVTNMRKMVAQNGRIHWFGTTQGSSLPCSSKTLYLHQQPQIRFIKSTNMPSALKNKINTSDKISKKYVNEEYYQAFDEEYIEEEIIDSKNVFNQHPVQFSAENLSILPKIVETINHLSNEIAYLRSQIESQPHGNSYGTVRKLKKRITDGRFGLHIYNEHNEKVLLSQLSNEEIINTIEISRTDDIRLIYGSNDITDLVLEKIDMSPYIHNPSLCGRMVADVLFSPEYLADKHILGECQVSSRTRLETLPPEMTQLFYDSLRKLGISRLVEDDQEHWLYLARDGVNQRARDLKANRKRKFYIDDQPLFGDEEQQY